MSCCPPNSLPPNPTKSDIEPIKVGSTNVFFYDNSSSTSLVLVFPDLFGTDSGRTKENCAKLSAHYKVALVDISDDYVTDMSKIPEWIPAHPFDSFVAKINEVVDHFKTVHGVTKIAAEGYCWGAWVVAKYSAYPSNALSAGISFHPSWGAEQFFNGEGSGAKIAEHITVPQLILAAGNDPDWLKPGGEVEKILESRGIASKLREFPTATHGWVNRGDLNDPVVAKDYHGAWDEESLPFLQKYLA
ncbi:hypothetical protein LEN26_001781 [Aphanomyces euteiches]|nr:hypothetical protein AeMF1_019402 [Aphanomyces euteiches]KAH9160613.1 hypothetical protein LEN26_001781 [Aphanomyces euteiches]KAH9193344.1 hypothetical protein AeNC1_004692 [Aphanomyces euteiches]